ncbi:hypothetical protein BDW74DRAFT_189499 [Aspergillus multicolor]|uniref:uncharacterized protein n=1 Tax=Aspergillus multicolor TaxID=41759 RepID=UPI003CCCBF98
MAPDKKDKKRKAAAAAATVDSPAKKTKKVEAKAAEPAESPKPILKKNKTNGAKENKASKPKTDGDAPRPIKPRKRAADYMSDEESEAEVPVKKAEKEIKAKPSAKKSKKEDGTAAPVKEKGGKKAKKVEIVPSDSEEDVAPVAEESEEDDDQTTALIRGFESSGDEDESGDEAIDPDAPVPKIPDSKKAKRKILKLQKQNKAGSSENPGVVYVGRIPHGFYEHQMRAYFTQFGEITKLRLSRNRHTGKSKHYAFIEFASESVAKIVAATMDNYLMYGHILKCKYVPSEQLHPELWKGANRRFKATPWNRIEKKRLDKGRTREKWTNHIEQEQKRRLAKAEKLKALGYQMPLPELKSIDEVPFQQPEEEVKAVEGEQEAEAKAIETPAEPAKADVEKTDDTPKKSKKEKKEKKKAIAEAPVESPKPKAAAAASPATKSKKKSKSKSKA